MEANMIIGFIVWSLTALVFLGIGISGWRAKEAVGFFTFVKPPIVNDVNGYNRSVSKLWIIATIVLEIIGIPSLFIEQNSPVFLVIGFGIVALLIGMMIAYIRIEAKYKK